MRVREVHSVNLGKEEKRVVKFLFGLLKLDGCVELVLTSISSKRKTQHVYRRISVKIRDRGGYVPIDCRTIARMLVEFIIGDRVSADFLLTFSYHYQGENKRRIRLADDGYVLTLTNKKGAFLFELTPWQGLFRTPPKAVLRMLLLGAEIMK